MNKDTNPLPTISFAEMQATMDYHKRASQAGPVGTAKAGILNALQDLEHGKITIPMFHQAINTILEALVEDVQGGKNEQT